MGALEARKLPPRRMVHAYWNLAMDGLTREDPPADLPGVRTAPLLDRFWDEFVGIATRRNPADDGDLYEHYELVESHYRRAAGRDRLAAHRKVMAALDKADASVWLRRAVGARFYMCYAWDGRGGGTADTVAGEG